MEISTPALAVSALIVLGVFGYQKIIEKLDLAESDALQDAADLRRDMEAVRKDIALRINEIGDLLRVASGQDEIKE